MRYSQPKITTKKLHISFFLTQTNLSDAMGFMFGNVAQAQSNASCEQNCFSACANCNNSEGALGDTTASGANEVAAATYEAGGTTNNQSSGSETSGQADSVTSSEGGNCSCTCDGACCNGY